MQLNNHTAPAINIATVTSVTDRVEEINQATSNVQRQIDDLNEKLSRLLPKESGVQGAYLAEQASCPFDETLLSIKSGLNSASDRLKYLTNHLKL